MDDIPLPLPFLLDGAIGTTLQNQGMPEGACPARWILEHSEEVQVRQRQFAAAGADCLCTPTGAANRPMLEQFGLADKTAEYNRRLAELTRCVAQGKAVAGTLSATGLAAPPIGDTDVETRIAIYAQQVDALEAAGVNLYLADSMTNVAEARAAILAVRERTKKPVLVTFACDGDGRTETGGDILAALIICQGMGASAFGIGNFSGDLSGLLEQMQRLAPHAQIPLMSLPQFGVQHPAWKPETIAAIAPIFAKVGVQVCGGGASAAHIAALRAALDAIDFSRFDQEEPLELDGLPCASEREARFISPLIDVGEEIVCSPHFVEDLLEAEDAPTGANKIVLDDEDDLDIFAENQYMIQEPLCLSSDNPKLLEQALRMYNGRAFYDGTGNLEPEVLLPLVEKYGLVVL